MKSSMEKSRIQGEGDYDSARKYDEQAHAFARSGKVEQAAKAAAPRNAQEKEAMQKAEAEGRSHAKGDPKQPRHEREQEPPSSVKPSRQAPGQRIPEHHDNEGNNPAPRKIPGR